MTANLHEQRGMYRVMLSWYQNGKRKQKNVATGIPVQGNNKREAEAARKRILREWEDKVTVNFQDIMFSSYLKQWLEDIKGSIEPTTHADYKKTVENIICPYFAERKIKLQDLKPYYIKDFYRQRMKDSGVSANTIHHYHANIRKALNDAVEDEVLKENPASKVKLPQKERFTSDFYTADELRLLLDKAIGEKIETPIVFAAWLGLRRGDG